MKSKNIWKYGFNWGSIVGGIYFLYNLLGFLMKIESSIFWSLLGTFIIVFGLVWAMANYKKNIAKENLSFGKYFSIGTVMCLVIALFVTLYMTIYTLKLNPLFYDNLLIQYQDMLDEMGLKINVLDNSEFQRLFQISFLPSSYISTFIGNLFYVLLLSFLLSRPTFGAPNQTPSNQNYNDYVPYKDVKEDTSEDDEKEEESSEKQENKDSLEK
ncbi:MAG: hypothetical protein H6Q16_54 [Bacteroidetes bacterium]|nr:hypothetical protein [Bacteroidota bacterium]